MFRAFLGGLRYFRSMHRSCFLLTEDTGIVLEVEGGLSIGGVLEKFSRSSFISNAT